MFCLIHFFVLVNLPACNVTFYSTKTVDFNSGLICTERPEGRGSRAQSWARPGAVTLLGWENSYHGV